VMQACKMLRTGLGVVCVLAMAACGASTPSSSAGHDAGVRDSGRDAVAVEAGRDALASDASLESTTPEAATADALPDIASHDASSDVAHDSTVDSPVAALDATHDAPVDAAPVVVSLAIDPPSLSLNSFCPPVQLHATATFSNASTEDVTTLAAWTSGTPVVATVGAMTGLVTCDGAGSSVISASFEGAIGTAVVSGPGPGLAVVSLSPTSASVGVGAAQAFTAEATLTDATMCNVATISSWTSSDTTVATVSSSGIATGVAPGTVTISATEGSVTGTATLTVE